MDEGNPNDVRTAPIRAPVEAMDTHFPALERDVASPFLMPIEDVFQLQSAVGIEPGMRFALREGNRTVGAGIVLAVT